MAQYERIDLLGVPIDRISMDSVISEIRGFISRGESRMIITADASAVVIAHDDADFMKIINEADIVTPDGTGILLASRILKLGIEQKVSGVDLARRLCELSGKEGFSIYFWGAAPGIVDEAVSNMKQAYPDINIAGSRHGFFKKYEEEAIVNEIASSGTNVLFVAMGIPLQEKIIKRNLAKTGVNVAIGVGGTLDVFSGRIERAPIWMQNNGLEWLHRLWKNPKKISKVALLPRFMFMVIAKKLGLRK